MILQLQGWCIDRELQVLSAMLAEANLPLVMGNFTNEGFEIFEDSVSLDIQNAITEYFAPGNPVVKVPDSERLKILQKVVDQLVIDGLGV